MGRKQFPIAKLGKSGHNQGMESFDMPGDQEIITAYAQGEGAVIALFQRTAALLAARVQALEGQASNNSPARLDETEPPGAAGPEALPRPAGEAQRAVRQGDLYWAPVGAEAGILHPQVVIQDDVINRSRVQSVVVCALTSNRNRAALPGNVLLEAGEANLPRQSVVEVSKVSTVDKQQLGEYIGSLTGERVEQILAGMRFLQSFTEPGGGDKRK